MGAVVLVGATVVTTWLVARPASAPSSTRQAPAVGPTALTPTTAPAAAPSPTPPVAHHAGETVAWQTGLKVTAYSFAFAAKGAPTPDTTGYVWGAIDVQVCVPIDGDISNQAWYLKYADNTTIEPSNITYNQFPHPEYPSYRTVTNGTCTRGWITFPVPPNTKPSLIVYSNTDGDAPVEWTV